jgi:hypothetical protein
MNEEVVVLEPHGGWEVVVKYGMTERAQWQRAAQAASLAAKPASPP